jgi:hypothetical protein
MAEDFVKIFKWYQVHLNHLEEPCMVLEQLPGRFDDYNENAP